MSGRWWRGMVRMTGMAGRSPLHRRTRLEHHGTVSQSAMGNDDYEAWRDLMEVLEERDAEWWAERDTDDEE